MSNKSLFGRLSKSFDQLITNESGGAAYKMEPRAALVQLATTSCLNNTLYVSAEKQLSQIIDLASKVDAKFIANLSVYSRQKYGMKDVPALLVAILAARRETGLMRKVWSKVINNGDMLRNFFEMIRSGQVGRRSFGTVPKQLMTMWFNSRTPDEVFEQSVGTPSMRDILRLIRPKPLDRTRSALYAWLVDKKYDFNLLPDKVQQYEQWKQGVVQDTPPVPFQMLTNQKLTTEQWADITRRAGWRWLLNNLNTINRHGVFNDPDMVELVAQKIADPELVKKSKQFPYRILTTYKHVEEGVPAKVRKALEPALDAATRNVPVLDTAKGGNPPVYLMIDVSGSMKYPLTGSRYGNRADTKMRRVDVAALFGCSILRQNPTAEVYLFNTKVVEFALAPKASVLQNSTAISNIAEGGTACSVPLKQLNDNDRHGDLVIYLSDDQSWAESMGIDRYGRKQTGETALQTEWKRWKARNPNAKMVCIDVAPYTTTQISPSEDILCCGGFSDILFELIGQFAAGRINSDYQIKAVESFDLDSQVVVSSLIEND